MSDQQPPSYSSEHDTVAISRQDYLDLRMAKEKLQRLQDYDVAAWEWYKEAMWPSEGPDIEEAEEALKAALGMS